MTRFHVFTWTRTSKKASLQFCETVNEAVEKEPHRLFTFNAPVPTYVICMTNNVLRRTKYHMTDHDTAGKQIHVHKHTTLRDDFHMSTIKAKEKCLLYF